MHTGRTPIHGPNEIVGHNKLERRADEVLQLFGDGPT